MSSNVGTKGGSVRKKAVRIHTTLYCTDSATGKFPVKDIHWYKSTRGRGTEGKRKAQAHYYVLDV